MALVLTETVIPASIRRVGTTHFTVDYPNVLEITVNGKVILDATDVMAIDVKDSTPVESIKDNIFNQGPPKGKTWNVGLVIEIEEL